MGEDINDRIAALQHDLAEARGALKFKAWGAEKQIADAKAGLRALGVDPDSPVSPGRRFHYEQAGSDVDVYCDGRFVAVMRPSGGGLGVWSADGRYLCEGGSIDSNMGWIKAKMTPNGEL